MVSYALRHFKCTKMKGLLFYSNFKNRMPFKDNFVFLISQLLKHQQKYHLPEVAPFPACKYGEA